MSAKEDVQALRASNEAGDFSKLLRRGEQIAADAKNGGFAQLAVYLRRDFRNFLAHGR
jgi:hypothetical protein